MTATERRFREAIENATLRRAVLITTERFLNGRNRAFAALRDGEKLRDLGRYIRIRSLARLDDNLARLRESCARNGIVVHWARDAAEARGIIANIAKGRRLAVKAKSMTTEEIELNDSLEREGIRVVETDLGEWVLQLADEHPSHIVAPALHKTRRDFADLIGEATKRDLPADPPRLVAAARERLRPDFVDADVGISGVNFAVAETGTLVLVTNEGNGRLVTSGPRVHIALMGMEKVVGTLDEVMTLLRLLPRSAAGQTLTANVTFLSGPRARDADGPEEVHLVVLDNGRTEYLGNDMWESLLCIRCGACLNACPVYRRVGGHAYGSTYQGPIGLPATAMIRPRDAAVRVELPHASSLCGACHEICPVRIDIPRMILSLRAQAAGAKMAPWLERMAFVVAGLVLRTPRLYRIALACARLLQAVFVRSGPLEFPAVLARWTAVRELPRVAPESFRAWWDRRAAKKGR